jgi:uroporphyrinogen decarboxylase
MDSRERILAVLNGEIPDKVPVLETSVDNLIITKHYGTKIPLGLEIQKIKWIEKVFPFWRSIEASGLKKPTGYIRGAKAAVDMAVKMGFDAAVIPISMFPILNTHTKAWRKRVFPHIDEYTDEYGRMFKITPTNYGFDTPFYTGGALTSEALYEEWGELDPHNPIRMATYDAAVQYATKNKFGKPFVIAGMGGISEMTWEALGMTFFAKVLRRRPEFLERVLDDRKKWVIEMIKDLANHGAEAVFIYDDYGYKRSTIVNPKDFRKYFAPRLKEIVDAAHSKKIKVFLHSCGNLNEILGDLVNAGIDALHPIEPTAYMDIFDIKKKYPNLTLVGNVSPQDLQDKSPDFIREYTERLMAEVKPGGHYILCSGHSINPAVKLENYLAMREVHDKKSQY